MSHVAFLVICVTWGASFILMERATHAFGPVGVGIGRLLGGASVLAVMWWVQRSRHSVSWPDVVRIAGVSLVGTALPYVVQPYCMSQGFGHSYFGMMMGLTPLATIAVSVPMLGVWPTRWQAIGVVGGLVCMVPLLQERTQRNMSAGLLALAVSVPVSYAVGNTYLKRRLAHMHALPLTTLVLALAAAWLLPLELVPGLLAKLQLAGPSRPHDLGAALGSLAILGVMGTGVAVLLFIHLVVTEGPLFAGMVTYVVPTMALAWGAVDGETVSARQIAAIVGILAMVALVQFGGWRDRKTAARGTSAEPHFVPSENPVDGVVADEE